MLKILELWQRLGATPIDDYGCIEVAFEHFPAGTHREEIWTWIEETFDVSANDLFVRRVPAWALMGYPLEPVQVLVESFEKADHLTDPVIVLTNGIRVFANLVYKTKPVKVLKADEFGAYTTWEGKRW